MAEMYGEMSNDMKGMRSFGSHLVPSLMQVWPVWTPNITDEYSKPTKRQTCMTAKIENYLALKEEKKDLKKNFKKSN